MPLPRSLSLLGAVLVALLLTTAPASAATADVSGGVLHYVAANGEFNELSVAPAGSRLAVRDPGVTALTPGPGCEADAGRLLCAAAGVGRIEVRAGDRADLIRLSVAIPTIVAGGPGDDQIIGGSGTDQIDGETGADYIEGGFGNDVLAGGAGRDLLAGGAGNDELHGGEDSDELNGDDGDDVLNGDQGNDRMSGGDGNDRLAGEGGTDSINAGRGVDAVDAGEGSDTVDVGDGEPDTVICGPGGDGARGDALDRVELDCERLRDPNGAIVRRGPASAPAPPDTSALQPLVPSPIVRVTGVVRGSRTQLQSLSVRAPSGSRVESRCRGRGCPYRKRVTRIAEGKGSVSLRNLRGRYRAGIVIEVFVTQPERLGKYTRLRTRRGKPPLRSDGCARADASKRVKCPF